MEKVFPAFANPSRTKLINWYNLPNVNFVVTGKATPEFFTNIKTTPMEINFFFPHNRAIYYSMIQLKDVLTGQKKLKLSFLLMMDYFCH